MLTVDDLARALGQTRWRTWRLIWALKPVMRAHCASPPGRPFAFHASALTVLARAKALVEGGTSHRALLGRLRRLSPRLEPRATLQTSR